MHVHCDNLGVVAVVNSGYSRVPQIMHLLRCLFFIRAHFQIDVVAFARGGEWSGGCDLTE